MFPPAQGPSPNLKPTDPFRPLQSSLSINKSFRYPEQRCSGVDAADLSVHRPHKRCMHIHPHPSHTLTSSRASEGGEKKNTTNDGTVTILLCAVSGQFQSPQKSELKVQLPMSHPFWKPTLAYLHTVANGLLASATFPITYTP